MKKQTTLALLLMLSLTAPIYGQRVNEPAAQSRFPSRSQTQQETPSTQQNKRPSNDDDDVVRINTNLVQVDAVVKDKSGKLVTNLRAEDFEVLENGKPQPITNFAFISVDSPATSSQPIAATAPPASKNKNAPPAPPVRLRPEDVRRTVALVVDDSCMTPSSMLSVRDALKKFVDEQMQPNDLIAIFRSSSGSGSLQQFTADKNQLYRAIKTVRWQPSAIGFNCGQTFATARDDSTIKLANAGGAQTFEDSGSKQARQRIEDLNKEAVAVGTLGTLRFVVRGLQGLPGRKSAVLISDGLSVFSSSGESDRRLNALRLVIDFANRASVVLYTMDARGVVNPEMATAADEVLPKSGDGGGGNNISKLAQERSSAYRESQNGLNYLAEETGGLFIRGTNKLDQGLRSIYNDQSGYYLIGYRPTDFTLKQGINFSKITIRVKQPNLSVRYRHGFYGITNESQRPKARVGDSELYAALASPLASGKVRLRLTSFFGNDPRTGSFMRSLLYIDPHDITFTDEPNGWKKLVLDVAAVTFGENGKIIDEFNRTHTIRAGGDTFTEVLRNGLVYSADVPVKKPGAYQLRIAVRDRVSNRLGSASQYIEVPDLQKDMLALSGIILSEAKPNIAPALPPSAAAEAALSPVKSPSDLAVRIFRRNSILSYGYLIYNPRLDRQTRQPKLTAQVKLFRDGQLVFDGPETPFDPGQQKDLTRFNDDGAFRITDTIAPGEYVLQVIVKDVLDIGKPRTASQWIDFEVVK